MQKINKIFYHTFIEVFGFHPSRAEEVFSKGLALKNELEKFNPELLQKDFIIAVSKSDLLDEELTEAIAKELPPHIPHIFISSAIQKNLVALKDILWKALNKPV